MKRKKSKVYLLSLEEMRSLCVELSKDPFIIKQYDKLKEVKSEEKSTN